MKQNNEIKTIEEETDDDMYNYCPLCGIDWSKEKSHECDKMLLVDRKKPRYYIFDLDNYNEEFLKEIILWQELKIKALQDINSISANEVGLKSF